MIIFLHDSFGMASAKGVNSTNMFLCNDLGKYSIMQLKSLAEVKENNRSVWCAQLLSLSRSYYSYLRIVSSMKYEDP